MDNETEIIKEFVLRLPRGLQDYVFSKVWAEKIILIEQNHRLTDEQSGALRGEIFLVLASVENYSDFRTNVQKSVRGIGDQTLLAVIADVERDIFTEVKNYLLDVEKLNNSTPQEQPNKEAILNDIENPPPTKPVVPYVSNPAGKNPVLDAQHNLPEGEKKVLISSSAVPSRGPILGNYKNNFAAATAVNRPTPPLNMAKEKPQTPGTQTPEPSVRQNPPPAKYTVDPYREKPE